MTQLKAGTIEKCFTNNNQKFIVEWDEENDVIIFHAKVKFTHMQIAEEVGAKKILGGAELSDGMRELAFIVRLC